MYLRKITACFVLLSLTASYGSTALAAEGSQCMMVVTYSEMASMQFKKAYKAKSNDDVKKFLKKGMEQAKEAAAYAPQCNCNLAETYALEVFAFGQKAEKASGTDTDAMQQHLKKAINLSIDAMAAAQKCNE